MMLVVPVVVLHSYIIHIYIYCMIYCLHLGDRFYTSIGIIHGGYTPKRYAWDPTYLFLFLPEDLFRLHLHIGPEQLTKGILSGARGSFWRM